MGVLGGVEAFERSVGYEMFEVRVGPEVIVLFPATARVKTLELAVRLEMDAEMMLG